MFEVVLRNLRVTYTQELSPVRATTITVPHTRTGGWLMDSKGTVFAELLLGRTALSNWTTNRPCVTIVIWWIVPIVTQQHNTNINNKHKQKNIQTQLINKLYTRESTGVQCNY